MIHTDKDIFIQETEVKPNRYATVVLLFFITGNLLCWVLCEFGIFRVGKIEMRVGCLLSFVAVLVPLLLFLFNQNSYRNPKMKYLIMSSTIFLTMSITTLLTFHTTIMLLFPIFVAMLYRSRNVGIMAALGSIFCTVFTPVFSYLLRTWDVPLFEELILIATNGTTDIQGAYDAYLWVSIGKILLFIVLPRLIMIGSCSLLLFYVIGLSEQNVQNQILLTNISRRDNLTGLFNRNYFNVLLQNNSEIGYAAVLFFDVNELKAINDSRGHEYGDLLLQQCAKSLTMVCDSPKNNAFRMGGDEYLVLMEDGDAASALKLIDRWKEALSSVNEEELCRTNHIVCSMAVGYAVGKMNDLAELVSNADTDMYRNKQRMKALNL